MLKLKLKLPKSGAPPRPNKPAAKPLEAAANATTDSLRAAMASYANAEADSKGDLLVDLSFLGTVKMLSPEMTFSVIGLDTPTCIVQTTLSLAELRSVVANANIIPVGDNLFRIANLRPASLELLVNNANIMTVQDEAASVGIKQSSFLTDTEISLSDTVTPIELSTLASTVTDSTTSWAIQRIFNRVLPYAYTVDRLVPLQKINTTVYVMDSGVNKLHSEFNNNVEDLYTFTAGDFADHIGHGTQMASVVVGKDVGVSPDFVKVKSVKIIDPSATTTLAALVDGFNAITADAVANPGIHVVNMSWVISKNPIIEGIIQNMIDTYGIKFVCAAGNTGTPIELLSPASMKTIITVGAVDASNAICGFNNYNTDPIDPTLPFFTATSVDIFAPGQGCKAADYLNTTGYVSSTGTSISSAYVSGVVALTALLVYPKITTHAILFDTLVNYSTKEVMTTTDPKFELMPNRIVWCLHSCPEVTPSTAFNQIYMKMHDAQANSILNNLPPDTSPAINMYTNLNEKDPTTNLLKNTQNYDIWHTNATGFVLSEPLTPETLNTPLTLYSITDNYFTKNTLTVYDDISALPVDITLQTKTTYPLTCVCLAGACNIVYTCPFTPGANQCWANMYGYCEIQQWYNSVQNGDWMVSYGCQYPSNWSPVENGGCGSNQCFLGQTLVSCA